jgi:hypothetical protein
MHPRRVYSLCLCWDREIRGFLQEITALHTRVAATNDLLQERKVYEKAAWSASRLHLAVLACEAALQRGSPATSEIAALQVAGDSDAAILKAIAQFPQAAQSAKGVSSLAAIQSRYVHVSKAARAAALTPEGAGIIGQAVGAATSVLLKSPEDASTSGSQLPAYITDAWGTVKEKTMTLFSSDQLPAVPTIPTADLPPSLTEGAQKGMDMVKEVAAVAKEKRIDIGRINTLFDQVDAAVAAGDIEAAVVLISGLSGYAGEATRDWVRAANARLAADRALSAVKARSALRTAALY